MNKRDAWQWIFVTHKNAYKVPLNSDIVGGYIYGLWGYSLISTKTYQAMLLELFRLRSDRSNFLGPRDNTVKVLQGRYA